MQTEFVISGFGGQGVLFAGELLAAAGMDADKHVTWFPSYGPEMRGGTANVTVIVSDEEIGSPLVTYPKVVVAMNLPSLDKYENMIKPGGLIALNTSIITKEVKRKDLRVLKVPANEIAEELGDRRLANMVIMGALLANEPVISIPQLKAALEHHLPERHRKLLPLNFQAIDKGATFSAS